MINDKLSEHLKGVADETQNLLNNIPLSGLDSDLADSIKTAQNALDFSKGESLEEKRNKLNTALDAITNYRRNL
jgi:hypothetical protein